eukprot:GHVS01058871.1.p1 GENE.GHVS01058871.1~~GHVS01058871.1.p1  ORF type:complete len:738 (-),score=103.44 GHVS01058871.1:746-2959(-)
MHPLFIILSFLFVGVLSASANLDISIFSSDLESKQNSAVSTSSAPLSPLSKLSTLLKAATHSSLFTNSVLHQRFSVTEAFASGPSRQVQDLPAAPQTQSPTQSPSTPYSDGTNGPPLFPTPDASFLTSLVFGSIHTTAYYFVDVAVGTPVPQRQSLILDTGSSVIGFPCSQCSSCSSTHLDPPLDLAGSSTDRPLQCSSTCTYCDTDKKKCGYSVTYLEGSSLKGYWYVDYMYFLVPKFPVEEAPSSPRADVEVSTSNLLSHIAVYTPFGCHMEETHLFTSQEASGILGLEVWSQYGPTTFIEAALVHTESIKEKIFSLCLAEEGGLFSLGKAHEQFHYLNDLIWTKMVVDNKRSYTVKMQGMQIEGEELFDRERRQERWNNSDGSEQDGGMTTLIDSGTTLSYFSITIYNKLVAAVKAHVKAKQRMGRPPIAMRGGDGWAGRTGPAMLEEQIEEGREATVVEEAGERRRVWEVTGMLEGAKERKGRRWLQEGKEGQGGEPQPIRNSYQATEASNLSSTQAAEPLFPFSSNSVFSPTYESPLRDCRVPSSSSLLPSCNLPHQQSDLTTSDPDTITATFLSSSDATGSSRFPPRSAPPRRARAVELGRNNDVCWYLSNPTEDLLLFPTITILFASSGSNPPLKVMWPPSSYLYTKGSISYRCLGFAADPSAANTAVLGSSFFINHDIIFDIDKMRLGVASARCPSVQLDRKQRQTKTAVVMQDGNPVTVQLGDPQSAQ